MTEIIIRLAAKNDLYLKEWICTVPVARALKIYAAAKKERDPELAEAVGITAHALAVLGVRAARGWVWVWLTIPRSPLRELATTLNALFRARSVESIRWSTQEVIRAALSLVPPEGREDFKLEIGSHLREIVAQDGVFEEAS